MDVDEAIMQMDLVDDAFLVFTNSRIRAGSMSYTAARTAITV
ncbi:MAG: sigma 54 modulation/S30EA ribosomal C-terminal domain-containing protein [Desulfobacterales bacterium]|nr:sigma 54 modulation/S30EA ribosomal C-terminal domain-containing protein [Desulfobacterales bacterium]